MKIIDDKTRTAVRALTDYLHADEEKNYQEAIDGGDKFAEAAHIFLSVQAVENWLDDTRETSGMPYARVGQMWSARSGRGVANQFTLHTDAGTFFQSYASIIAFKPKGSGKVVLDRDCWDYSTTTGKYRNEFLGEGIAETRKKIADGTYVLAKLN